MTSGDVESYLSKSHEALQAGGVGSLPIGSHVRDDEQVGFNWLMLFTFLKKCFFRPYTYYCNAATTVKRHFEEDE